MNKYKKIEARLFRGICVKALILVVLVLLIGQLEGVALGIVIGAIIVLVILTINEVCWHSHVFNIVYSKGNGGRDYEA